MRKKDTSLSVVGAVLIAGCVMTLMSGDLLHWIPILLALGVVGSIPRSVGR